MRYENWKDLKPLSTPVALGAKCVCLADWHTFKKGAVVTVTKHFGFSTWCVDKNKKENIMGYYELALLPEDAHEPEQKPMTTSDLLARAQSTYPPTGVLRIVCKRIGTASQIADELRLGEHGARTVRSWISDPRKVPFSVWFTLLAIDEANREP